MEDAVGGGTGRARNTATIEETDILRMTAGLGCDGWKRKSQVPIVCVPGCPVQPDDMMVTILYLLFT
jgi:hypothetical protein